MSRTRLKAVCVVRRGNELLLIDTHAPHDENFRVCVPVGGGINFGEHSKDAAARETLEEISAVVINLKLLMVIENMFSYAGTDYHEIIFAYEGDFEDESLYQKEQIQGIESTGQEFVCSWIDIDLIKSEEIAFFPTQLIEVL